MKFVTPLLIVLLLFFNSNLESSYFESSQDDNYVIRLSKKELDSNTTYFLSEELFNGKKFTIKGFKIKFSGRPLVTSKEMAFGNNLKYILKRQEVGGRILIYDIETFMLEGEKITKKPSSSIGLEVVFTE